MITGERVTVPEGGFNPTFQRHVAAYRLCAPRLGEGRVLDLGCGVGHSFAELAPRETVGVDVDPGALAGQERETVAADMRRLPFPDASFSSVISVHSIEHIPDPERALREVARVLSPGGRAVFVTPNRLTFGPPEEIIDPYHYVEFDAAELAALCAEAFARVDVLGLFGSARYQRLVDAERRELDRLLRLDPLRLRRLIPRRARQRLYDRRLAASRAVPAPGALDIAPEDFSLAPGPLATALDLVAVCA
ncbi:MAG TPA: class I SAM-dependent methyltransferase [Solirubrobacteraceae bacterium]|nr:class I SAM-dependent methyltransferase [Solirubrobacteraceae bacterium]